MDWMVQREQQERFEHEAVQVFADYVEMVGLDYALTRVLGVLKERDNERKSRFNETSDLDTF